MYEIIKDLRNTDYDINMNIFLDIFYNLKNPWIKHIIIDTIFNPYRVGNITDIGIKQNLGEESKFWDPSMHEMFKSREGALITKAEPNRE